MLKLRLKQGLTVGVPDCPAFRPESHDTPTSTQLARKVPHKSYIRQAVTPGPPVSHSTTGAAALRLRFSK